MLPVVLLGQWAAGWGTITHGASIPLNTCSEHLLCTKPRNGCAQFGAYASQVPHSTARPAFSVPLLHGTLGSAQVSSFSIQSHTFPDHPCKSQNLSDKNSCISWQFSLSKVRNSLIKKFKKKSQQNKLKSFSFYSTSTVACFHHTALTACEYLLANVNKAFRNPDMVSKFP